MPTDVCVRLGRALISTSRLIMQEVIRFLRLLHANNRREWFLEHKAEYGAAQARFNEFAESLVHRIARFDPSVAGLTAKDITYRIYRDTRFSADKTPYKTHMGAYICRGGKKSGYSGYYVQVGVEAEAAHFGDIRWATQNILAVGDYCLPPKVLQIVREDIVGGEGDFDRIVRNEADVRFRLVKDGALKRNPKGFDKDAPWSEYLRLKMYCLACSLAEEEIVATDAPDRIAELLMTAKPFLDYVNRAVDYVREGGE